MVNLVERLSGNWNYDMRTTLPCGIDRFVEEGDLFFLSGSVSLAFARVLYFWRVSMSL
jgi:hypothetical protein